jgi:hypothetical protein
MARSSPFGDGHASERIVKAIKSHFEMGKRPGDFKHKADVKPIKAPEKTVDFPKRTAV